MKKANSSVQVAIIMGSDSDLGIMKEAAAVLDELRVKYELTIVSAHRTPERMVKYAQSATSRGLRIIIAGAGGAAHLPGMVASLTELPVIGVPVQSKAMSGLDSLYSIVQMPPGIPVATMAINGAKNAGLLAVRIIALADDEVRKNLQQYVTDQAESVLKKATVLEALGYKDYLQGRS